MTRDVEHYGQQIREGSVLLLMTGAANRDERKFDDPDRFDIHRNMQQHLAFGYGIHFCLGSHLARLEGRIALEEVLARFPDLGGRLGRRRAGPHVDGAGVGIVACRRCRRRDRRRGCPCGLCQGSISNSASTRAVSAPNGDAGVSTGRACGGATASSGGTGRVGPEKAELTADIDTSRNQRPPSARARKQASAAVRPVRGSAMASAQNSGTSFLQTTNPPAAAASSPKATRLAASPARP